MFEKKVTEVSNTNLEGKRDSSLSKSVSVLKVPRILTTDTVVAATPRRVYANAHAYHINSISVCSDGETFLSADDLRVNLWNLELSSQTFTTVDIKPENMEELTEVVTSSEFHPSSCNIFLYSSSKGTIKLADLRQAALCDRHSKIFEEREDPSKKSFFSEIMYVPTHTHLTPTHTHTHFITNPHTVRRCRMQGSRGTDGTLLRVTT